MPVYSFAADVLEATPASVPQVSSLCPAIVPVRCLSQSAAELVYRVRFPPQVTVDEDKADAKLGVGLLKWSACGRYLLTRNGTIWQG